LYLQSANLNAPHRGDLCLAEALLNHRGDAGEPFVSQSFHHLIRQPMAGLRF
jgi:hypothetical protein